MIEPITANQMRAGFERWGRRTTRGTCARDIINAVAKRRFLTVADILGPSREWHVSRARHEAMHAVHTQMLMSPNAMTKIFQRDRKTIASGIRRWKQHWSKQ